MIPQLLLEEILNGEKNEKDFYAKYGKEELQAALAELKKSNEEILSAYPAEAMKGEIIKKAMMQKNEPQRRLLVSSTLSERSVCREAAERV